MDATRVLHKKNWGLSPKENACICNQQDDAMTPEVQNDAGEMVRRYADAVYRFVLARCGRDSVLAQDVVQETFLGAIRGYREFRQEASLYTWLCAIARRQLALALRGARRDASFLEGVRMRDERVAHLVERMEQAPLEESDLEREEVRAVVGAAVTALPPRYREALEAKYMNDEPTESLARRLGLSIKGIESLLGRARLAFREGLKA